MRFELDLYMLSVAFVYKAYVCYQVYDFEEYGFWSRSFIMNLRKA